MTKPNVDTIVSILESSNRWKPKWKINSDSLRNLEYYDSSNLWVGELYLENDLHLYFSISADDMKVESLSRFCGEPGFLWQDILWVIVTILGIGANCVVDDFFKVISFFMALGFSFLGPSSMKDVLDMSGNFQLIELKNKRILKVIATTTLFLTAYLVCLYLGEK